MIKFFQWKIAQVAELKWWKNYLKKTSLSDYKKYKSNYWNELLITISPFTNISKEQTILDAGCGPAGIFIVFDHHKVTAIDPLLDTYDKNISHFKKQNYPNVTFINSAIEDYTSTNTYDHVFCINCINHVANINSSVKNLNRLTKSNGKLYLSIDTHNFNMLKWIFRILPFDILHPHQHNLAEYETMLTKQGFILEKSLCLKKRFIFNYHLIIATKQ